MFVSWASLEKAIQSPKVKKKQWAPRSAESDVQVIEATYGSREKTGRGQKSCVDDDFLTVSAPPPRAQRRHPQVPSSPTATRPRCEVEVQCAMLRQTYLTTEAALEHPRARHIPLHLELRLWLNSTK